MSAASTPAPRSKTRPPRLSEAVVPRRRLEHRLEATQARRLTSIVADAGFGKTTLIASWIGDRPHAWYECGPEDADARVFAAGLADALERLFPVRAETRAAITAPSGPSAGASDRAHVTAGLLWDGAPDEGDIYLVIDDADRLRGSAESCALLDALVRYAPSGAHLICASRSGLPIEVERLRGRGQVLELSGADLLLDADEVAEMLGDVPQGIVDLAGGWPAAVRLLAEAPDGPRIPEAGEPLFAYLSSEVFKGKPAEWAAVIRDAARLERFDGRLLEGLGHAGASAILRDLARQGLFVRPLTGHEGWYTLSPLIRDYALASMPIDDEQDLLVRAAEMLEARGRSGDALRCAVASGDGVALAAFLRRSGDAALRAGYVDAVIDAVRRLPQRDAESWRLEGEARQVRGDWDGAVACFERVRAAEPEPSPALAWRLGLIHYLRGRLDDALATFQSARVDGTSLRDDAMLLAWRATTHRVRGEADLCEIHATNALHRAREAGDPQALAAAHTVLAMHSRFSGDRAAAEEHDARALQAATEAGDLLQLARIRANRGGHLVDDGRFDEAVHELNEALSIAERSGFANFRALALSNRGEARHRLGMLDDAIADLEAACALYERLGSSALSYPLGHLAGALASRGDTTLARATFERAITLAEGSGDVQGLVPSLAGLARMLAADDPERAVALVERAASLDDTPAVRLAQAAVAAAADDPALAAAHASAAAQEAARRIDLATLADALVVGGSAAAEQDTAIRRLREAISIAERIGARLIRAGAHAALATRTIGDESARHAEQAAALLRDCGVRARPAAVAARASAHDLEIAVLGGFRVLRRGTPVPVSAWRSKKARDLLKMLVVRRGKPAPRDALMEALWPDEDPTVLGNRLSVALATLRAVLDPDRSLPPFLVADRNSVALDYTYVRVDVEAFLHAAAEALDAADDVRFDALADAEAMYAGELLEGDPYDDWAVTLREEARGVYVTVARALCNEAVSRGRPETAVRAARRILERDSYDEPAHLTLVRTLAGSGRHGEARRAYRDYCTRMDELGVEAAPFPSPQR